jgi:hypothetical protein
MKREDVIAEMKKSIGTREPLFFFEKMVDVFTLLFDRIDELENKLDLTKMQTALAIQWEPKVARAMLTAQINVLRQDKETYFNEIDLLKRAFAADVVTQNYSDFCRFWEDTLGYHPFMEYE